MNDYTEQRRKMLESLGLIRSRAEVWWILVGETMRLGMRIVVLWAAVAEWGWLRGLGAAFALLLLEDALREPKR